MMLGPMFSSSFAEVLLKFGGLNCEVFVVSLVICLSRWFVSCPQVGKNSVSNLELLQIT